ncbi:dihydropteroate synthase [Croceicoccus sp. F390]|uniref:dihydropteroate synthase n=1 Tax=Croceicoccus esteveae TaxID=3075597 RepID=A0ABU2ZHX5_9SPHN|nr:dihydropteroate synthase [Croceicoccus sp. F390]MDT0575012.1 dihydropteroate synthase [Croceicoccus sp. F390]
MERVYIRPVAFVDAPQLVGVTQEAVRLGGSMVYACRFALIRRDDDGRVIDWHMTDSVGMTRALGKLPDALAAAGEEQWANLRRSQPPLVLPLFNRDRRIIPLDQPQMMGILNVTPDSFSDGNAYAGAPDQAVAAGVRMLEAGAAIIDIGGESTRPGAAPVYEEEEQARVLPVIKGLAATGAALSVDTRNATVMAAAIAAGARIINDVSALRFDPRATQIIADADVTVVLMHASGSGSDLHAGAGSSNVVLDVFDWLAERRDRAIAAGIARDRIILDPGIGFGKSLAENLALINALPLFHALGQPLLVGASRKRMIGALSKEAPADRRLGGSVAIAGKIMDAGVPLLRVHDVAETRQAADIWRGLKDAALTDFSQIPEDLA